MLVFNLIVSSAAISAEQPLCEVKELIGSSIVTSCLALFVLVVRVSALLDEQLSQLQIAVLSCAVSRVVTTIVTIAVVMCEQLALVVHQ